MQTLLRHNVPNLVNKIVLIVNHLVLHQCQCSTHERRATLTGLLRLSTMNRLYTDRVERAP
jgi:hypothetical protein